MKEDIIKMAREAGFNWPEIHTTTVEERLERFFRAAYDAGAATALKAALAEPVQEPAFHGFMSADGTRVDLCFTPGAPRADGVYATAYYTAPPKRPAEAVQEPETVDQRVVPLVESALQTVAEKIGDQCAVWYGIGARDVEEVLREAARHGLVRAALAEPVQEPVRLQCTTCGTVYADGVPPQVPVREPVQEPQGCDHCNHPLYAATKCRVCGRVTEPTTEDSSAVEPVQPVAHKHEWFSTGAMKPGQMRCIHCGVWNHEIPPQRPAEPAQEPVHGIGGEE